MNAKTQCMVALLALALLRAVSAEDKEDPAEKLKAVEASLKQTPEDPMLHYRKAQFLMKLEKREDGYKAAQAAMQLFIKAKNDLAWMMLENIPFENGRIDFHFNMGPRERKPPEIGIVKPLSFRVWSKDNALVGIYDFEIGMFDSKPSTGAFCQTTGERHANFAGIEPDSTYEQIRAKALEIIKKQSAK